MVLDVNVGLPELDEPEMMALLIPQLQSVTDLPLQIDTSDPAAMERGMRLYNGCPLVNSVSGKTESMEVVFPLMKKYGGVAIALTLDEQGIPATAEARLAIARRIVETAARYGIPKEDLVFDTLAMAVSAEPTAARTTLEALALIRSELGCHTSLGVSNISFGLPQREKVNAAFFLMALERGLSAAILNPNSAAMMGRVPRVLRPERPGRQLSGVYCGHGGRDLRAAGPGTGGFRRAGSARCRDPGPPGERRPGRPGGACGKDADGDHRCRADPRPGPCGDRV